MQLAAAQRLRFVLLAKPAASTHLIRIEDFTDISYNLNKEEMFGHPAAFDWRRTPKTFHDVLDSYQDSTFHNPASKGNINLDQYPHIPLYGKLSRCVHVHEHTFYTNTRACCAARASSRSGSPGRAWANPRGIVTRCGQR